MGENLHKNFLEVSGMAMANMANALLNCKKADCLRRLDFFPSRRAWGVCWSLAVIAFHYPKL
jgi:hypothetical protein